MIIRRFEDDLLLIAQVDHAALAARIMTAWRADGFPERPTRARVLEATDRHDLGWQIVDAAPSIDPETGRPYDFVGAPLDVRQGVWPRAVDQLASQDPYIAALVAHHAATVYRRFLQTPGWEAFFPNMERRRDDLLATQAVGRDTFLRDYAIVAVGDLCSLVFCNTSQGPQAREGYRVTLHERVIPREQADTSIIDGGWLEITPDPFEGATVRLDVPGWRVPARRYASDADLRDSVAQAPIVHLTGVAAGAVYSAPTPR